jgi:predicted DNA-binding transcriptional regulator YafY
MRQLRQMLRLHHDGVSAREIARTLGVARSTIQDDFGQARAVYNLAPKLCAVHPPKQPSVRGVFCFSGYKAGALAYAA